MGWVPGFENDVFISYARVDNLTVENNPDRGWVAQFHKHLEVALSKKVGRLNTVRIWRDIRELQGNQLFDRTIQDAIGGSALFVALTSNGYLQSAYCRQELEWFCDKARKESIGLSAGDDYRVFNVLLNNIPPSAWPQEYGRTSGFPFHDSVDPHQDGEPTDFVNERFRGQLRALVDAVYETLERIRGQKPVPSPAPEESTKSRIYLADTSDTLAGIRKRLINELKQSSIIELATGVPPPFEAANHDQKVRAELERADLSVHLLDALPGREMVDKEGVCYPQRQIELALAHGKSQLIWTPQGLTLESVEDAGYRDLLNRLENGERGQQAYDFVRELPSSIAQQIFAKVDALKSQVPSAGTPASDATLLDTHIKDQIHAFELGQYLLKRNIQPYIVQQEDDPTKNEDLFNDSLKRAAVLIVFYGAVTVEWVRARLAHALKAALMIEGCQLRACGVYMAPPHKPDAAGQFDIPAVPVQWMDHTSGFNATAVDQLLARAHAAGARS